MNKSILFLIAAAAAVSCGTTAKVATDSNGHEYDEVNIGYGTVSKNSNAFSVSEAKMSEAEETIFNDMYDYLRNRVPGVEVENSSGSGSTPKITVRGEKTIGLGTEQDPLFILDGETIQDINVIRPDEVYSVQVLKGAAASSYGSRSANGVIMITSKFAHDTAEREAAAKKAARLEKKEAKKK